MGIAEHQSNYSLVQKIEERQWNPLSSALNFLVLEAVGLPHLMAEPMYHVHTGVVLFKGKLTGSNTRKYGGKWDCPRCSRTPRKSRRDREPESEVVISWPFVLLFGICGDGLVCFFYWWSDSVGRIPLFWLASSISNCQDQIKVEILALYFLSTLNFPISWASLWP